MNKVSPAPEVVKYLSETSSLILAQDARSETNLADDNPATQEQLDQTTTEIQNDTPDTSETRSLQSTEEQEQPSVEDVISQLDEQETTDINTEGMNKVSPAPEITKSLSDNNSLILSQDARAELNWTEYNQATEEQLDQTTTEIQIETPDPSETRSLQSTEVQEKPSVEDAISQLDEQETADIAAEDTRPQTNLSTEIPLAQPPTEDEIYQTVDETEVQEQPSVVDAVSQLDEQETTDRNAEDTKSGTNLSTETPLEHQTTADEIFQTVDELDIQDVASVQGTLSQFTKFAGYEIIKRYAGETIKIGTRVVKKIKTSGDDDDIGTIVNVEESGKEVEVLWDPSDEKQLYCTGKKNQFDLLLFDNAQIGVKHTDVSCHECFEYPLRGIRWKCLNCHDVDLCTSCYMNDEHDDTHIFRRIESEDTKGVEVPHRFDIRMTGYTLACGIQEGADVVLRKNDSITGKVVEIHDFKRKTFRSDAIVKWGTDHESCHAVGREGKCELMILTKTKGVQYYEDLLPSVTKEYAKVGVRVVKEDTGNDDNEREDCVGTIVSIQQGTDNELLVHVQWDNGTNISYNLKDKKLRIFDNGPAGIHHDHICMECKKPVQGMRWKCMKCKDEPNSLCTDCYMLGKHKIADHIFSRIVEPSKTSTTLKSRDNATQKLYYGIFEETKVSKIFPLPGVDGEVLTICDGLIDYGRYEIEVEWLNEKSQANHTSRHSILDLKCEAIAISFYYPDHLPILGKDTLGHLDVAFNDDNITKKINVDIWYRVEKENRPSYKPVLYLIFANHQELDIQDIDDNKIQKEDKFVLMEEVMEFSKKTKLPCHVVGQKVLFYHHDHGSLNTVFIHHKTSKDTIKELVKKGYHTFQRGDTDDQESEIDYFHRMASDVLGEKVLPVIISLRNGGLTSEVIDGAQNLLIPIVRFKKNSSEVAVLTLEKEGFRNTTQHTTNLKTPWAAKKSTTFYAEATDYTDNQEEISSISNVQSNLDFEVLICHIVIGVSMANQDEVYGEDTELYANALSMFLLKNGKWHIPKECIKKYFDHRSIEYIYEEDLTNEFEKGLWCDLKEMTGLAYEPPRWKEKDVDTPGDEEEEHDTATVGATEESDDIDNVVDEEEEHETQTILTTEETEDIDNVVGEEEEHETQNILPTEVSGGVDTLGNEEEEHNTATVVTTAESEEKTMMLAVSISELYGLIFLALLQRKFYSGAKQLVETGCVRIHHILIGCIILQEAIDEWRTTHIERKKLQILKVALTQRAIQITSCIYETESKKEKSKEQNATNKEEVENELGEPVSHASRLLLNHGYLEDAIKTQNKTFLDNTTVNKILNKMWYGESNLSFRQIWCFILLATIHFIMMPLMMINMEARPLKWFYKKYKLPFMKVFVQMIGYLGLLVTYSYMLLFNLNKELSYTDFMIIGWMISFFLDETKQAIVSALRKRFKNYLNDWWNRLDWTVMLAYTSAMGFKFGDDQIYHDTSKILLVVTFILLSIRILHMFSMSEFLGPKLVMIQKMFKDTFAFMIIMSVIMMSYNVSFYSLLYPNSDMSWSEIEKVMQNGYWMLFGELNLDSDTLKEPDCTFDKTIYTSGALSRCPSTLGLYVSPYLKAAYGLIAVILLLNLLIAIYSDTFQQVHQESEFHWSQLQTDFLEEYSVKTIFPIHLQLLALPVCIVHFIIWCTFPYLCSKIKAQCIKAKCMKKNTDDDEENRNTDKLNDSPMFVRVFLYNTNFDLRLKSTNEAEGNGALKSKGTIEVLEEDKISILQNKMDIQTKKFEKHHERNNRKNDKMLKKLKKINANIKKMMLTSGIVEEEGQSQSSENSDGNFSESETKEYDELDRWWQ